MRPVYPALPLKTRSSPEYSLVLDLDATLVHVTDVPMRNLSFTFSYISSRNGITKNYGRTRPFFQEFMQRMAPQFELILFTAAKKAYANAIMDLYDPNRIWMKYRLYRDHCIEDEHGHYIKDLNILGRDLSKVIIVDDYPTAFRNQRENGIQIKKWDGDQNDTALMDLVPFLENLLRRNDVRPDILDYVPELD